MMDRQLKQRVVGAGLLVAFGVIFIPIFLDNGGVESPVPASMNIPPAPTEDVSQRAPALGEEAIAEIRDELLGTYPTLTIDVELVQSRPVDALIEVKRKVLGTSPYTSEKAYEAAYMRLRSVIAQVIKWQRFTH